MNKRNVATYIKETLLDMASLRLDVAASTALRGASSKDGLEYNQSYSSASGHYLDKG